METWWGSLDPFMQTLGHRYFCLSGLDYSKCHDLCGDGLRNEF